MAYNIIDTKDNDYQIIQGDYYTDFNAGEVFSNILEKYFPGTVQLNELSTRTGRDNRKEILYKCSFIDAKYSSSDFYIYCFQTEGGGRATLPDEGRIQWRRYSDWTPTLDIAHVALDFHQTFTVAGSLQNKECYIFSLYKRDQTDDDIILSSAYSSLASNHENSSTSSKSIQFKIDDMRSAYEHGISYTTKTGGERIIHFKPRYLFWYMANRDTLHSAGLEELNNIIVEISKFEHSTTLNEPKVIDSLNSIFFGAPGTGKSHTIDELTKDISQQLVEKITFHPEYDHASFVGCYKPVSHDDNIKYEFTPQVFTNIYIKAWKDLCSNGEESKYHYLIIDEINRGNCAEIFGDLFQLLDRKDNGESKYEITPSEDLKKYLITKLGAEHEGIIDGKMRLPANLVILATMNTSDQSLYPMDSAFKRRWDWVYVPIEYEPKCSDGRVNDSHSFEVLFEGEKTFRWIDFINAVNETKIKHNSNLGADKQIGNYFIKPKESSDSTNEEKKFEKINLKDFIHKVMFYLWNDVFKDERKEDSIFGDKTYQDLFPIETNGLFMIENILKELKVDVTEKPEVVPTENAD